MGKGAGIPGNGPRIGKRAKVGFSGWGASAYRNDGTLVRLLQRPRCRWPAPHALLARALASRPLCTTQLEKLLWKEKRRDTARMLQLCRFIVDNGFFDDPHAEFVYPRSPPEPTGRLPFADPEVSAEEEEEDYGDGDGHEAAS